MKVTTELKNLIKDEFSKKRSIIEQDAREFQKEKYNEAINEIESDKSFKVLKEAANQLYEKYGTRFVNDRKTYETTENDFCYITSTMNTLQDLKGSCLFANNSYSYNKLNLYGDKIKELNKQEQSLLIKLTYEKDIDVIKSMLQEYDINVL